MATSLMRPEDREPPAETARLEPASAPTTPPALSTGRSSQESSEAIPSNREPVPAPAPPPVVTDTPAAQPPSIVKPKPAAPSEKSPDTTQEEKSDIPQRLNPTELFNLDRRTPSLEAIAEDDQAEDVKTSDNKPTKAKEMESPILDLIDVPERAFPTTPKSPAKPARKKDVAPAKTPKIRLKIPAALLREWRDRLVRRIDSAAKAGKPLSGAVRIHGKSKIYPLLGADCDGLRVEINGNPMPVMWSWLVLRDQTTLVKSLASENDLESQLMLAVFLKANGQDAPCTRALEAAEMLDASAANKIRQALR
jgi:hypothetical protein